MTKTVLLAPSLRDCVYAGPAGNLSIAKGQVTLKAAPVNCEVHLLELPIGLELVGVRVISSGLGEGVNASIALTETDVTDIEIKSTVDVSANAAHVYPITPVYLTSKKTLEVTLTGAEATGTLTVMPEYLSVGF